MIGNVLHGSVARRSVAGTLFFLLGIAPAFAQITYTGNVVTAGTTAITTTPISPWSVGTLLTVGNTLDGTLTISGGASVSNTTGTIGNALGITGAVTVTDAGSIWTNSNPLTIGNAGNGTLDILAGGLVTNTNGVIASGASSTSTVTVKNANSTWTNSGSLTIGNAGTGTLNIQDGGTVTNGNGFIGSASGAIGTVNVDNATWTNSGSLNVGGNSSVGTIPAGNGTLTISNGGVVYAQSTNISYVGLNIGSVGTVTINAGSQWNVTAALTLGNTVGNGSNASAKGHVTVTNTNALLDVGGVLTVGNAGNGTLDVLAGGKVTSSSGIVGGVGSSVSTATVSGANSRWENTGSLTIGGNETGGTATGGTGTLNIFAGGYVSSSTGTLGTKTDTDGTVTVSGTDGVNPSTWAMTGALIVGKVGTGTLNIQSGGVVSNTTGTVGSAAGSNGTVTVEGGNSQWTMNGGLTVGNSGTGTLNIKNGGKVTNTTTALSVIGAGGNGTVTVEDSGSSWTTNPTLRVGGSGTGTLNIFDGGVVTTVAGWLGETAASGVGIVNIDGVGSQWNTTSLSIGYRGKGTISITDGGLLTSAGGNIGGVGGSSNSSSVTVDGEGARWTSSGALNIGNINVAGLLAIKNGGYVSSIGLSTITSSANTTSSVTVDGTDGNGVASTWENTGNVQVGGIGGSTFGHGTLDITHGGIVKTTGSLSIAVVSGSTGVVTVDGANGGATLTSAALVVGLNGTGTLDIKNGGKVSSTTGTVGSSPSSIGTATVDGSNSQWTMTSTLTVGSGSSTGVLTLSNGGTATATSATVGGASGVINIGAAENATAVAAGTLTLTGAANTVTLGTNGSLVFNHTETGYVFTPTISGSGLSTGAVKVRAGTTIFTANNTYSGITTIANNATLRLGDGAGGGTAGSITGSVSNNGTLEFNRSNTVTYGGVISGSGAVNQIGTDTTIFTNNNTYIGLTTISAGTLQLGSGVNGGASGSLGTGNIVDNSHLVINRNNTATVTLAGVISGTGDLSQIGSGTTILSGNNSYEGGTKITNGVLELQDANAAGSGGVAVNTTATSTTTGLRFALNNAGEFANVLSGVGTSTVAFNTAKVTITADNSASYSGNWQIAGEAEIGGAATNSQTNLGSGTVTILSGGLNNGILHANTTTATTYTFNNSLAGNGTLWADGSGGAFTFANTATVGTAFTGTVHLTNNTFALDTVTAPNNAAVLAGAKLLVGAGNFTTVSSGNPAVINTQYIGGLAFDGGILYFNDNVIADPLTPGIIVNNGGTGGLNLNGPGQVRVNVPANFVSNLPTSPNTSLPLLEQEVQVNLSKLVGISGSTSVSGSGGNLVLLDENGNEIADPTIIGIVQNNYTVAYGHYGLRLSPTVNTDGLYVVYGLTQVDLWGNINCTSHRTGDCSNNPIAPDNENALTLTPGPSADTELYPGAAADAADFARDLSAKVTDGYNTVTAATVVGDLEIDAGAGGVVSLSNSGNDYHGQTLVSSGTLIFGAPNTTAGDSTSTFLGNTSFLRVASGATVDMNGYSQKIGAIDTMLNAKVIVSAGSTLTITDAQRATGDTLGGGIDGNTLFGAGVFVIDPSIVYVNGDQPAFTGVNIITGGSQEIVNSASVYNAAKGVVLETEDDKLTFGDTTFYDVTWTATPNGTASVALSGLGTVEINDGSDVTFSGDNAAGFVDGATTYPGFSGKFSINSNGLDDASTMTVTEAKNLGTATASIVNAGIFIVNTSTDWTMSNEMSGAGKFNKNGSGTLTIDHANTNMTGETTINGGVLKLDVATGVGSGSITINTPQHSTTTGLELNFSTDSIFANNLIGAGTTTVTGSSKATITADNSASYTGDWQIAGKAAIADTSATSQKNLGTGIVNILPGGILYADTTSATGDFTFNNALHGGGTLAASNGGNAFDFGSAIAAATGANFTGVLQLTNNKFLLDGDNTTALEKATLSIGDGNVTTVGALPQTIGGLRFDGTTPAAAGTIIFDATAPAQTTATNLLTVTKLDVSGIGAVRIIVPSNASPYDLVTPTPLNQSSLFAQSHVTDGLQLVAVTDPLTNPVVGSATGLALQDQNGIAISNGKDVNIAQGGSVVAIGTYDYTLGTGSANDGLYVGYALKTINILTTLKLTEDVGAMGDDADMAAKITGAGDLVIAANTLVSLSNPLNDFTGTTEVQSGTLQAGAANVIGQSSAVTLLAGTKFDTNGYDQTIKNLSGDGDILLSDIINPLGNTLTLEGGATANTFAGAISGNGGVTQNSGTQIWTGANTYTGDTNLVGGILRAGALNALSANSAMIVGVNGALDLGGFSQQVKGLDNSGIVTFSSTGTGAGFQPTVLIVNGDYFGNNGTIVFNTVLGNTASSTDKLVITGDTSGSTNVAVINAGGLGDQTTGNGIPLIEVHGASNGGFFALSSRVAAGAFEYNLTQEADGNWYLQSFALPGTTGTPIYRPEVPIDMIAPALASRLGLAMLGTYDQRTGNTGSGSFCIGNNDKTSWQSDCPSLMWGRVFGESGAFGENNRNGSFGKGGPGYDYDYGGFQTGADLYRAEQNSAGFYVGAATLRADVSRAGSVDMNAYSLGVYWTHRSPIGWYTDAVLQGTRYANVRTRSQAGQNFDTDGTGLIASVEGGHAFDLGGDYSLIPQAQLIYQRVKLNNSADDYGRVRYDATNEVYARLGAKLAKADGADATTWAEINLWQQLADDSARTTFTTLTGTSPTKLDADLGGTWAQIGLGISGQLTPLVSIFGAADYNYSLDQPGHSVGGRVGVRVMW
ncbi:MAG: autotransporter outer membrane beta-barrel domain-containing protein [Methylobacillus sp.]|jgi:outer membrane autotransporter protein|nr:autotransporter outer membrane beta-barrel domain-containing protein [Methylobacillus sp.]